MSKGLEALDKIKAQTNIEELFDYSLSLIKKELKALEIIKEKRVNVWCLLRVSLEKYNTAFVYQNWRKLTHEEYELLKEVFL